MSDPVTRCERERMNATSRNPALALAFGETVRSVRESAGVAQGALALIAEMDRSYLGRLERGEKQPSLDVVFRLAAALGVAPAIWWRVLRCNHARQRRQNGLGDSFFCAISFLLK